MHLAGMNRYQAFGIHFGISLLIFIGLVCMVLFVWYPGILKEVDESWKQALIMIAGVDLVLGPLLTLIVFNPIKKSLKMDLSVIAVAQIAALIAGTYTVHQARPVALIVSFPPVGFKVVSANMLQSSALEKVEADRQLTFYYSGPELFGPNSTLELTEQTLAPTTDIHFSQFITSKAPIALFQRDDQNLHFPIEGQSSSILLNKSGMILGLTSNSD